MMGKSGIGAAGRRKQTADDLEGRPERRQAGRDERRFGARHLVPGRALGEWPRGLGHSSYWLAGAALIAATAAILLAMGRVPICECGEIKLWTADVSSADNSQHIADWYTPSHLIHGILFYAGLWLAARRLPLGLRALAALAIEAGWEILENSPIIIDRYRESTIALGCYGDSVLNSVSDILFMLVGFWIAARAPLWLSALLVVALELFVGAMIRDNLTLNIIMLLWPSEAVKAWQMGGS